MKGYTGNLKRMYDMRTRQADEFLPVGEEVPRCLGRNAVKRRDTRIKQMENVRRARTR